MRDVPTIILVILIISHLKWLEGLVDIVEVTTPFSFGIQPYGSPMMKVGLGDSDPPAQKRSPTSMSERIFVNGGGVGLEDLRRRARQHLGSDIVIEPSSYNVGR